MRSLILFKVSVLSLFAVLGDGTSCAAEDAKTKESLSVFGEATLQVPDAFERTKPQSTIVEDEFVAKSGEGDDQVTARLYMMRSGGSMKENLARWRQQFSAADAEGFKTKELKLGDWDVVIAEHAGTYSERMGGGPFSGGRVVERPDSAMLAAILVAPDSENATAELDNRRKYFIKMIGPEAVIEANRDSFMQLVKSLKP